MHSTKSLKRSKRNKTLIVKGLIIPAVYWNNFDNDCKEYFGVSPLRSLDRIGLASNSLLSLPYIIDKDYKNLDSLNYGLYAIVPNDLIPRLFAGKIIISIIYQNDKEALIILTGSLTDWIFAIQRNCKRSSDEDIRKFYNECLKVFEATPLKKVFGFSKENIGGSFLVHRNTSEG